MPRPKRRNAPEANYFLIKSHLPEPSIADDIPIPFRIQQDPQKKALWDLIIHDMDKRQCLSPSYALIIGEMVEVMDMMHRCRESIDKHGLTIDTFDADGNYLGTKPNPHVMILATQQRTFMKITEKLGMTPRDIVFLTMPEPVETPSSPEAIEAQSTRVTYFRDAKQRNLP